MSQAINRDADLAEPKAGKSHVASRIVRPLLMIGGVAVLVIGGGIWWLHGGRIVSVDDAYIRAAKVSASTDVSGIVASVAVHEGEIVQKNQLLLKLDDRPFRIALEGARADLAQVVLNTEAAKRDYQRMLHATQAAQSNVAGDQASFDRFSNLVRSGGVTRSEFDDARYKLAADQQRVEELRVQAQVQLAKLAGNADIDPAQTPAYQQAQARVDEMQRQLDHTVIKAPFPAIATQVDNVQPGMYLAASTPAFAMVSTERVWAEGNPKETELTNVRPGQAVTVTVDTYPGQSWHGRVESISPAAGSEFSVLPAQNTSGNWVKVVQRIPIRVSLDRSEGGPDLRSGMSVSIEIDTGHVRTVSDIF